MVGGMLESEGVAGGVVESGSGTVALVGCSVSGDGASVIGWSVFGNIFSIGCFLLTSVVACMCCGLVGGVYGGLVGGVCGG